MNENNSAAKAQTGRRLFERSHHIRKFQHMLL